MIFVDLLHNMELLTLAALVSTAITDISACSFTDKVDTTSNALFLTCECSDTNREMMGFAIKMKTKGQTKRLVWGGKMEYKGRNAVVTKYRFPNDSYVFITLRLDLPKESVTQETFQCVPSGFDSNGSPQIWAHEHVVRYERHYTTATPSATTTRAATSSTTTTSTISVTATTTATTPTTTATTAAPTTSEGTRDTLKEQETEEEPWILPTGLLLLVVAGGVFVLLFVVIIALFAYYIARRRRKRRPSTTPLTGDNMEVVQSILDAISSQDATRGLRRHATLPTTPSRGGFAQTATRPDFHRARAQQFSGNEAGDVATKRPKLSSSLPSNRICSYSSVHIYEGVDLEIGSSSLAAGDVLCAGESSLPEAMSGGRLLGGGEFSSGESSYATAYDDSVTCSMWNRRHPAPDSRGGGGSSIDTLNNTTPLGQISTNIPQPGFCPTSGCGEVEGGSSLYLTPTDENRQTETSLSPASRMDNVPSVCITPISDNYRGNDQSDTYLIPGRRLECQATPRVTTSSGRNACFVAGSADPTPPFASFPRPGTPSSPELQVLPEAPLIPDFR